MEQDLVRSYKNSKHLVRSDKVLIRFFSWAVQVQLPTPRDMPHPVTLDFTYVSLSADDLDHWLLGEVHGFASSLCQQGMEHTSGKVHYVSSKLMIA